MPMPKTRIAAAPKQVGVRIAQTREVLGLNQSQLARRLGAKPNKISQWESGTHLPSLAAAIAFCDVCGVTLDWIFRGDETSRPAAGAA